MRGTELWRFLNVRIKSSVRPVTKIYNAFLHAVARASESPWMTLFQMLQEGKRICGLLSHELIQHLQHTNQKSQHRPAATIENDNGFDFQRHRLSAKICIS